MHVLIVHPSAELYGSDRMMAIATAALVSRGHTVTVILAGHGPLVDTFRRASIPVTVVYTPVLRKSGMSLVGFLKLMAQVLASLLSIQRTMRSINPDVVYINTIVQPWWIAAGRLFRKPVVVHVREAEPQIPRYLKRAIYAPLMLADTILCNSISTRGDILGALPIPGTRASVIYNGKDWSAYEQRPRNDHRGTSSTKVRLSVIGRLSPRKGQDLAIQALASIVSNGVDASLTVAGDIFPGYEWYETELRQAAAALGIAERVDFVGFQDDVSVVLSDTDIALVPSRIEPFGTVAAECMAACLPTIVADVQGLAEIVTDGETGLTFATGDHEALAKCCQWLIANPAKSIEIAHRGYSSVKERFSLERYESEIVTAIENAKATRRHGE